MQALIFMQRYLKTELPHCHTSPICIGNVWAASLVPGQIQMNGSSEQWDKMWFHSKLRIFWKLSSGRSSTDWKLTDPVEFLHKTYGKPIFRLPGPGSIEVIDKTPTDMNRQGYYLMNHKKFPLEWYSSSNMFNPEPEFPTVTSDLGFSQELEHPLH